MAELLLEILSEEIPARMQSRAALDLERLAGESLKDAGLRWDSAKAQVTPRRLALVVDGLPEATPDVREERRGPRVGAPDKALEGFLRSVGKTLEDCERRETDKGAFWFCVLERKGRPAPDVILEVLEDVLARFPWPKSMRWGTRAERWVRPLHGLVCLFAGDVVPLAFAGVQAGRETVGHRFLAPARFAVKDAADHAVRLAEARVVLDREERKRLIRKGAQRLAASQGLSLRDDPVLLDEVAGLVEWPRPLIGGIDETFLEVPSEVLVSAMRTHQKYFALNDADGRMAPRFIVVANMESADGGAAIVTGNERVLRARLSDARFFWDQDRKASLESRVPRLKDRVFHALLGSEAEKVERIGHLAMTIMPHVPGAEERWVRRAALLCKADLSTGMVGEFPELQGVMGRYYALYDGEPRPVADAVAEHYAPLGPSDACPAKPVSVVIALADKLDTLAGFWSIDEKPTGSKDPYALRRAALGVIRIILENRLRLPLAKVLEAALRLHDPKAFFGGEELAAYVRPGRDDLAKLLRPYVDDLLAFFAERLKVHLRESGVRHDFVAAVFERGGEDDLVRLLARVEALSGFLSSEDGANLLTAYRRAANIVRIEEKKDGASHDAPPDAALLQEDEERALFEALKTVSEQARAALTAEDFAAAMAALARLRGPVDAFFDQVTVNCEDPGFRANRLRLLSGIGRAMGEIADFSRIEG